MTEINQNNHKLKLKLSIVGMLIALDLFSGFRLNQYSQMIVAGEINEPILKTILNMFFPMSSGTSFEVVQIILNSLSLGFKLIFSLHLIIYGLFYFEKRFSAGYIKIYSYYSIGCSFVGLYFMEWFYLIYLPIYFLILFLLKKLRTKPESLERENLSAKEESNQEA